MDWLYFLLLMLGGLLALLMMGLPVAFAFLTVSMLGAYELLGGDRGLVQLARNSVQAVSNPQLAPIPLFILMGEILLQTGVAQRAIDAVDRVVTRVPGRLSVVTVLGGTVFAALSGSTIANTAMLGSSMLPGMLRRGYHPTLAMGPIMASGAIAMLIPPSALVVLVGSLAGISIAGLLLAGIVPALLLALFSIGYIVTRSVLDPLAAPPDRQPVMSGAERWRPFIVNVLPLSLIFLAVVGSLLGGIASPTESAALGAIAALLASIAYRCLSRAAMILALRNTLRLSVMILFILATSQTFAQLLSFSGATRGLLETIRLIDPGPGLLLLAMIVLLLVLGCFVDQVSMLMITVPVFAPLAAAAGIDPLVLGLAYLLTMEIGLLTPPFGLLLFVMRSVAPPEVTLHQIYCAAAPFVLINIAVLTLLIWQPALATWLPAVLGP